MSTKSDSLNPFDAVGLPGETTRLPDGGPLARVYVCANEIEAQVLHDVLDGEGIHHTVQSYRDTAYDGLFQVTRGWGAIITREEDAERAIALIRRALDELLGS